MMPTIPCATDGHHNRPATITGTFDNPHTDEQPVRVGYCAACEDVLDTLGLFFFTPDEHQHTDDSCCRKHGHHVSPHRGGGCLLR